MSNILVKCGYNLALSQKLLHHTSFRFLHNTTNYG